MVTRRCARWDHFEPPVGPDGAKITGQNPGLFESSNALPNTRCRHSIPLRELYHSHAGQTGRRRPSGTALRAMKMALTTTDSDRTPRFQRGWFADSRFGAVDVGLAAACLLQICCFCVSSEP